jgi:hypothetical protein
MRTSKQKFIFWILVAVVVALSAACSTDNNKSGQGQEDATKPPPQVRVETLPTNTALPELPTEAIASPTVEPTAAEAFVWPTPDEDTIVNDIDSLMNDIDNKLKSEDINIKP